LTFIFSLLILVGVVVLIPSPSWRDQMSLR
jgi:hypothetical protein